MTKIITHKPKKLPINIDYNKVVKNLGEAQYRIGLLEGLQKKFPNPSLLISPLTAKEAAVSSKIEGTQSTASDVFMYEVGGESRHSDTAEVANYKRAMIYAINSVKKGTSISLSLIKTLHQILLTKVRHRGEIGKFRDRQVWIAEKDGDPIEKATYIPPESFLVVEHMDNLLEYVEKSDENILVKIGLLHYQFEAIHPFEDGNGRIGRLLIPLVLYYKKILSLPIIYISGYFDKRRDDYINALHEVDKNEKYEDWLNLFFKAVAAQSEETLVLIEKIYGLYDEIRKAFEKNKSPYFLPLLDYIFKSPVFTVPMLINKLKSSRLTVVRLLEELEEKNMIKKIPFRYKRAKLYNFNKLLELLR